MSMSAKGMVGKHQISQMYNKPEEVLTFYPGCFALLTRY